MTNDIDDLMDGLYQEGKSSITKENVHILRIFLQRAFPDVGSQALSDAAALLTVYCTLVIEGKHISVDGNELDAEGLRQFFDSYAQKLSGEFTSPKELYEFYGSAIAVAMFVYKYTAGFTNTDIIFAKTRGGDASDRIAAAISNKEIR